MKEFVPKQLPAEHYAEWLRVQRSNPTFAGPCFHPELYRVVSEFFPSTRVGVDEKSGAFLPYQTESKPLIGPVPACDYQAVIQPTGGSVDVIKALENLGYVAWDFENLLATQIEPKPSFVLKENFSRKILIPGSYENYLEELKKQGKSGKNLATKRRLLERDIGPIRFVSDTKDVSLLKLIYEWKTKRFGGISDPMQKMIEKILHTDREGFRGYLSALYAKDTVVAVHFGMQADGVFFYWFPAFNPEMGRYTPGGLLLQELCAHLKDFHSTAMDLGPGGETYKDYFCNQKISLLCGSYERPSTVIYLRKFKREILRAVRENAFLYGAAKTVANTARSLKKVGK